MRSNENEEIRLDYSDSYIDDKRVRMVRRIATEQEARDLIDKYHSDKMIKENETPKYKKWKYEQKRKGIKQTHNP